MGKDRLIQARRIVVRSGGISCERNGLKYIKMKMWTGGRAWRKVPMRRSSEMKALCDWALQQGLEEYNLNVGRRPCSILNEIRAQEKKNCGRQEMLK